MSKPRFSSQRHPFLQKFKKVRITFILCFVLILFFLYFTYHMNQSNLDKQYESLNLALQHDIVHCYAVEGTYPPSLQYMVEHYGLLYDHDLFYVDYQPIGSNIYPNYEIIKRY